MQTSLIPLVPIINPITFFLNESRATDTIPLNNVSLAEAAGVTRQTIQKTVMGLYSSIPVKLVNYMSTHPVGEADHSVTSWNKHYDAFISYEMNVLKENIAKGTMEAEALYTKPEALKVHYPTFTAWRESLSYSQIDFCKTFLLHQAIVSKYEAGLMKNLPESLVNRLKFIGLPVGYINALEELPVNHKGGYVTNKRGV